jgi:hypothetical protein
MISRTESERLLAYHPFDEDVLATVEEVAGRQRAMDFAEINTTLPPNDVFWSEGNLPIKVLDTGLNDDTDKTLVYHMAMGSPLDENERTRLAALHAALPTTRIITSGAPGAPGEWSGRITLKQFPSVFKGDLRATIDPLLRYVNYRGVETITHAGYSYGADKAPTAAEYSDKYDQSVEQVIAMDPASVVDRKWLGLKSLGIIQLGLDFNSAEPAMQGYVDASDSPALIEARAQGDARHHGLLGYSVGLLRTSNIAAAKALSKGGFAGRMTKALIENPEMRADSIWGSLSELSLNGLMTAIVSNLEEQFGPGRVTGTIMEGQKHTMCDDIFLHTAMVLQALKKNKK